jgi:hypothetical protein
VQLSDEPSGGTRVKLEFTHPMPNVLLQVQVGSVSVEGHMRDILSENFEDYRAAVEAEAARRGVGGGAGSGSGPASSSGSDSGGARPPGVLKQRVEAAKQQAAAGGGAAGRAAAAPRRDCVQRDRRGSGAQAARQDARRDCGGRQRSGRCGSGRGRAAAAAGAAAGSGGATKARAPQPPLDGGQRQRARRACAGGSRRQARAPPHIAVARLARPRPLYRPRHPLSAID